MKTIAIDLWNKSVDTSTRNDTVSPALDHPGWSAVSSMTASFATMLDEMYEASEGNKEESLSIGDAWIRHHTGIPYALVERTAIAEMQDLTFEMSRASTPTAFAGSWILGFIDGLMGQRGETRAQTLVRQAAFANRLEGQEEYEKHLGIPYSIISNWSYVIAIFWTCFTFGAMDPKEVLHQRASCWSTGFVTGWNYDRLVGA